MFDCLFVFVCLLRLLLNEALLRLKPMQLHQSSSEEQHECTWENIAPPEGHCAKGVMHLKSSKKQKMWSG